MAEAAESSRRTAGSEIGDTGRQHMLEVLQLNRSDHLGMVRTGGRKDLNAKGGQQRKTNVDKKGQHCDHCDKNGHTKETCFKLHGTPDSYKELIDKKKKEMAPIRGYIA
ncbi:UNVERIFIED_CONTAM: hypothetical protein Sangu_2972400 [Sesamum angustifolium]|uniref:Uncharacterized protein n=1 Tax=Sesamum angustifolium TaxID=2727405 RepID=A0AAW2IIT4_9LAMI